ncbi:hypothetical protein [Alicyclobacillus mali (ex Roth et al. 2021)]|uniref:hypothetical protein n=1 Tax=Alicyclobacillus mali (ex Roth et al. 2021) TaxID=1123961 RepID=UPI001A8DDDD4|nr:hypothetical protein [Alicyclobacillus mali (ex Roth et al. 2021)]
MRFVLSGLSVISSLFGVCYGLFTPYTYLFVHNYLQPKQEFIDLIYSVHMAFPSHVWGLAVTSMLMAVESILSLVRKHQRVFCVILAVIYLSFLPSGLFKLDGFLFWMPSLFIILVGLFIKKVKKVIVNEKIE